jgi:hypothetical protein
LARNIPAGHDQDKDTGHEPGPRRKDAVDLTGHEKHHSDRGVEVSLQWVDTNLDTVCEPVNVLCRLD